VVPFLCRLAALFSKSVAITSRNGTSWDDSAVSKDFDSRCMTSTITAQMRHQFHVAGLWGVACATQDFNRWALSSPSTIKTSCQRHLASALRISRILSKVTLHPDVPDSRSYVPRQAMDVFTQIGES
jgi:hypothetical protein